MDTVKNHKSVTVKGELLKQIQDETVILTSIKEVHDFYEEFPDKRNIPNGTRDYISLTELRKIWKTENSVIEQAKCELYDALGSDKIEDVAAVIKKWFGVLE